MDDPFKNYRKKFRIWKNDRRLKFELNHYKDSDTRDSKGNGSYGHSYGEFVFE